MGKSSWGKHHGDLPHGVNGGCTRPKGPGHIAEGLGVNCPPLGLSGHCSSPGGKALQSYCLCTHCTAALLLHFILRSSAVHNVQKFGCTLYRV